MQSSPDAASAALPVYAFGPYRLDAAERRLHRGNEEILLTRKAFDVLLVLVEGAGRLQTRDALIQAVWQDTVVEEHGLTWYLSVLRKTLGGAGEDTRYIETVRGCGYRFVAPVTRCLTTPGLPQTTPAPAAATEEPQHVAPTAMAAEVRAADAAVRPSRSPAWVGLLLPTLFATLFAGAFATWLFQRGHDTAALPAVAPRSVALLPFETQASDADMAYFAGGMRNAIGTKLAGLDALHVVSRASSESYPSRPQDLRRVAAELGVATLLQGSVQRSGATVRVSVVLIDGASGRDLWAQSYDRALQDVLAIESEIAGQIAAALQTRLQPAEAARLAASPTADAEAYRLFLQADYQAWQITIWGIRNTREALDQAVALYDRAIARDPRFALAMARKSYLESYAYWMFIDRAAARAQSAEHAARAAVALAPQTAAAHLALGYAHYYGRRDYAAALAEFEIARAQLPNDAEIIGAIAHLRRRQGQFEQALAGYAEAERRDPRNPNWPNLIGDTLAMQHRLTAAETAYARAEAIDPKNPYAAINRTFMWLFAGEPQRARRALAAIPADSGPAGARMAAQFQLAWLDHDAGRALQALADAPEWMDNPWMQGSVPSALLRAEAHALAGDPIAAATGYATAKRLVEDALSAQPDTPMLLSLLGVAEAGLGRREAALQAATRATDLVPPERDAYDAPYYLAMRIGVLARNGEREAAVAAARELQDMASGHAFSAGLLQRDPRFREIHAPVP